MSGIGTEVCATDMFDEPGNGRLVAVRKFNGTYWQVHSLDMQWDIAGSIDDVIELVDSYGANSVLVVW